VLTILLSVVGMSVFIFSLASSTQGAEGKPGWKAKWEKTVQAAKREGQINLYGDQEINHPAILEVFKKNYPDIKIVTVSGHAEIIQRIVAERRARKYLVDVTSGGPGQNRTAYLANFLQPIRPHLMLPEVTDTTAWYGGQHFFPDPENKHIFLYEGTPGSASIAYNTKKLSNLDQIRSYWDVLDAKWRGNIGFFSYGRGMGALRRVALRTYALLNSFRARAKGSGLNLSVSR